MPRGEFFPQFPCNMSITDRNAVSVVVPVLDDAEALSLLAEDLRRQQGVKLDIVVADGGSTDDLENALEMTDARIISSKPGRARQMNRGADDAAESMFLFLHADSRLPHRDMLASAVRRWRAEEAKYGDRRTAGRFPLRFCGTDTSTLRYRFLETKTTLDKPWVFNGDQGLMIHRQFFEKLGGFDATRPFLEDQVIGRAIDRRGRWVVFDEAIETSARRFEKEGFWRRYAAMVLIMGAFAAEFDEFFEAHSDLYLPQQQTGPPSVCEWTRTANQLLAELAPDRRLELIERVGRLIRENTWQPFVLLDLAAGLDARALEFYERRIEPRLDHPLVDRLMGTLASGPLIDLFCAIEKARNRCSEPDQSSSATKSAD